MNNPFQLMQMARNPQGFIQNLMNNSQFMQDPIGRNAFELYQKGDKQGLNDLVDNLCKEKGINRQDLEKQIRSQFGM